MILVLIAVSMSGMIYGRMDISYISIYTGKLDGLFLFVLFIQASYR